MSFTLPMFQLGAKTSTCVTVFSLRKAAVMSCTPSVSIMFDLTVRHSKTVMSCKSHFASFVRTNTNKAVLSAERTVVCIALTQIVTENCFVQVMRYDRARHLKSSFAVSDALLWFLWNLWFPVVALQSFFQSVQASAVCCTRLSVLM